jgi:hypothetical protein
MSGDKGHHDWYFRLDRFILKRIAGTIHLFGFPGLLLFLRCDTDEQTALWNFHIRRRLVLASAPGESMGAAALGSP